MQSCQATEMWGMTMPFFRQPEFDLQDVGTIISETVFRPSEKHRSNLTAGPKSINRGLTLQAMGRALDRGGLWFMVRGVEPGVQHDLEAFYPDGRKYTYLLSGKNDAFGAASDMRWNPFTTANGRPDPEGVYRIIFTDPRTGRSVTARFLVSYGRSPRDIALFGLRFGEAWVRRLAAKLLREVKRRRS